jgi:GT2 family glycosyltransferase
MFCSVIIPTIGRASLARAVTSVLDQDFPQTDFEIIIVNDLGRPLPNGACPAGQQVRLITTRRRERSVARNTGAAVARGRYLCFLDDDDWLLPDALQHWSTAASQAPDAAWIGGGIRVLDASNSVLGEAHARLTGNCFAQVMGGAWAPIQASLVRAKDFFLVGGFDPSIKGTEDLDLCRKIALQGEFAHTPAMVACLLRGLSWKTSTDYQRAPLDILRSREAALNQSGSLARLVSAARASGQPAYWFGRIVRVYASTFQLAAREKRGWSAASRAIAGLAGSWAAGPHLFSKHLWEAARASHVPGELHYIMLAYERSRKTGKRVPAG